METFSEIENSLPEIKQLSQEQAPAQQEGTEPTLWTAKTMSLSQQVELFSSSQVSSPEKSNFTRASLASLSFSMFSKTGDDDDLSGDILEEAIHSKPHPSSAPSPEPNCSSIAKPQLLCLESAPPENVIVVDPPAVKCKETLSALTPKAPTLKSLGSSVSMHPISNLRKGQVLARVDPPVIKRKEVLANMHHKAPTLKPLGLPEHVNLIAEMRNRQDSSVLAKTLAPSATAEFALPPPIQSLKQFHVQPAARCSRTRRLIYGTKRHPLAPRDMTVEAGRNGDDLSHHPSLGSEQWECIDPQELPSSPGNPPADEESTNILPIVSPLPPRRMALISPVPARPQFSPQVQGCNAPIATSTPQKGIFGLELSPVSPPAWENLSNHSIEFDEYSGDFGSLALGPKVSIPLSQLT